MNNILKDYEFYYECQHCGKEAFLYNQMPAAGHILSSKNAYYPKQERIPWDGEEVRCDSCNAKIYLENNILPIQNLKERKKK